jgi:hypothetical protein
MYQTIEYRGREGKNICIISQDTKVEVTGHLHILMTSPPVECKFVLSIISCRSVVFFGPFMSPQSLQADARIMPEIGHNHFHIILQLTIHRHSKL